MIPTYGPPSIPTSSSAKSARKTIAAQVVSTVPARLSGWRVRAAMNPFIDLLLRAVRKPLPGSHAQRRRYSAAGPDATPAPVPVPPTPRGSPRPARRQAGDPPQTQTASRPYHSMNQDRRVPVLAGLPPDRVRGRQTRGPNPAGRCPDRPPAPEHPRPSGVARITPKGTGFGPLRHVIVPASAGRDGRLARREPGGKEGEPEGGRRRRHVALPAERHRAQEVDLGHLRREASPPGPQEADQQPGAEPQRSPGAEQCRRQARRASARGGD